MPCSGPYWQPGRNIANKVHVLRLPNIMMFKIPKIGHMDSKWPTNFYRGMAEHFWFWKDLADWNTARSSLQPGDYVTNFKPFHVCLTHLDASRGTWNMVWRWAQSQISENADQVPLDVIRSNGTEKA